MTIILICAALSGSSALRIFSARAQPGSSNSTSVRCSHDILMLGESAPFACRRLGARRLSGAVGHWQPGGAGPRGEPAASTRLRRDAGSKNTASCAQRAVCGYCGARPGAAWGPWATSGHVRFCTAVEGRTDIRERPNQAPELSDDCRLTDGLLRIHLLFGTFYSPSALHDGGSNATRFAYRLPDDGTFFSRRGRP